MSNAIIWLTPLLVLLIVAVFVRFTGCGKALLDDEIPLPERKYPEEKQPAPTPPLPARKAYEEAVEKNTKGFAALWPLNETGGNIAEVIGSLKPDANGTYTTAAGASGTGFTIKQDGALHHKDTDDHAPEFDGTAGYIDVEFNGQLNPVDASFSIELWVKPNPDPDTPDTQVLVSSHRFDSASLQQGYEIALIRDPLETNQKVRARVFKKGTTKDVFAQPFGSEEPTDWRHVVMTYEASPTPGEDGSLSILVTVANILAKTKNPYKGGPVPAYCESVTSLKEAKLRFAAGHEMGQAAENFFAGRIDNVAFYNGVLDQTAIKAHLGFF